MSIPRFWLDGGAPAHALAPLAHLYGVASTLRRRAYEKGWWRRPQLPVPVLVVGNLFVGGTGKTPFVVWLVEQLQERGWHPAVVARGYGGRAGKGPIPVHEDEDPTRVGDEPLLLARRTGAPVYVGSDRPAAVMAAHQHTGCDVVVSDDGLQHYRMRRRAEIIILDAQRRLGNGQLLPAGPLREPPSRLCEVDLVAINGDPVAESPCTFQLQPGVPRAVDGSARPWCGGPAHLVAGIGHPERFFATAVGAGYEVAGYHPFPDHHPFRPEELAFGDRVPVLMTEKDSVRSRHLPQASWAWYLPVTLIPSAVLEEVVDGLLANLAVGEQRT
ncbi:MAG: tetraacyldisaccharide 4'-kinase [Halorhodospira sp.]